MIINGKALIYSTIVVAWLIVAMTIFGELSPSLKSFFTGIAGHHWVGKSIATVLVFALSYLFMSKIEESGNMAKGTFAVFASAIAGGLIIFFFFVWHFISAL